jgi:malonyl-CoA O-methyltransferase
MSALGRLRAPTASGPQRALAWIRAHEASAGGILVHSRRDRAYPEVSGYLVPTLLAWGERELAARLVSWLVRIQQPDGAYPSPDGVPYVFDTGQVLRGLLAEPGLATGAAEAARRAADFLCRCLVDGGRGGFGVHYAGTIIPETIQLYVLPALLRAAEVLDAPRYGAAARACLEHYVAHADLLRIGTLTHFLAYELEALIDLGCANVAAPVLRVLAAEQGADGAVRALPGAHWVCTPGLIQLAICWYKTGEWERAERALSWVEARQKPSGGFVGSYGRGATYFPKVELSWAAKFYLDAHRLRVLR